MPISPDVSREERLALAAIYATAERTMLALVAHRIEDGIDRDDWASRQLAEVGLLRHQLTSVMARVETRLPSLVRTLIRASWSKGLSSAGTDLSAAGRTAAALDIDVIAVESLVFETTRSLRQTHLLAVSRTADAYERIIRDASAQALTGAVTRRQAAQQALDVFARIGIRGYTDRAGRRWELASYVEAATRAATARAAINAHTQRLEASGEHLVIVSDSPQECPLCRPLEGQVLVLDGHAPPPGVPVWGSLKEAEGRGLFHPGCTHAISLYIHGVTPRFGKTSNPQGYEDRQKLRRLERSLREAKRREQAAITPQARTQASARVRARQAAIREHVDTTSAKRQPHREQINVAR